MVFPVGSRQGYAVRGKRMSKFVDESLGACRDKRGGGFLLLHVCRFRKSASIFSLNSLTRGLRHRSGGVGLFVSDAWLASLTVCQAFLSVQHECEEK
jgi:hypothetical protein